jgi:hypothetical protein
MDEKSHDGHEGHRESSIGAERMRSGFDRRRNWGDSIENVYRRIDSRLSELVRPGARPSQSSQPGAPLEALPSEFQSIWEEARSLVRENPGACIGLALVAGALAGTWFGSQLAAGSDLSTKGNLSETLNSLRGLIDEALAKLEA